MNAVTRMHSLTTCISSLPSYYYPSYSLFFLERFSCDHLHKFLNLNAKNVQQYSGELSSSHPSKKVLEEGCKGEP